MKPSDHERPIPSPPSGERAGVRGQLGRKGRLTRGDVTDGRDGEDRRVLAPTCPSPPPSPPMGERESERREPYPRSPWRRRPLDAFSDNYKVASSKPVV